MTSPARGRGTLALACAAQLMVVLDVSVINVALPAIGADLGSSRTELQWVTGGYLLAFGGLLLLGGRLADLYGRRRTFVAGLALFTAASLAGGLAADPVLLVLARAGQGVGAAVLAPTTLTLLTTTFPEGHRRTRALANWTAVSVAGGAAGNLLSGVLTEYLTWRATLLINVPLGVAAAAVALRALPTAPPHDTVAPGTAVRPTAARRPRNRSTGPGSRPRLDVPGAVLATGGLAALSFAVTRVPDRGWTDTATLGALAGAVLLLVAFAVVEARFAAVPLLPLRLLANRSVSAGNAGILLAGACFQAPMWYFLTFCMQDLLGYTAVQTGLGFLPHTLVTIAVGWRATPWLMRRVPGRALVVAGALLVAAGFVWQSRITPGSGYLTGILGPAVVFSAGGGLLNTPLTATVTSGVAVDDAGAASGLMNTTKQVGGALGLAVLVTVAARGAAGTDYPVAFLACAGILVLVAVAAGLLPRARPVTG